MRSRFELRRRRPGAPSFRSAGAGVTVTNASTASRPGGRMPGRRFPRYSAVYSASTTATGQATARYPASRVGRQKTTFSSQPRIHGDSTSRLLHPWKNRFDDACCITALSENAASLSISPSADSGCWVCYANSREDIVEVHCSHHVSWQTRRNRPQ